MNALDKIRQLTDKKNGPGISVRTICKYCFIHPTTLDYYMNEGHEPSQEVLDWYETSLQTMLADIKRIIDGYDDKYEVPM